MTRDDEIQMLKDRVLALEKANDLLKKELDFLKTFPALAQGLKGEILVAQLTGGVRTGYADSHDVVVKNGDRIEVKFSHLNVPGHSKTKRWNWSRPLGWKDKGKNYDFLFLVGEKDPRYEAQYPADLPYVCFLVPRCDVDSIKSSGSAIGANVALNTNLATARAEKSEALKRHMVVSGTTFTTLFTRVTAP